MLGSEQVGQLEPNLRVPPEQAVFTSTDGAVDPVAVTEALVAGATRHGAAVRLGQAVIRLRVNGDGGIVGVDTSAGSLASRSVVVATGTNAPLLAHHSVLTSGSSPPRPCCSGSTHPEG